jgi:putative endonuclease
MTPWFVYVLQSTQYPFRYVGMSQNPKRRLAEHNSGKVKSTKHYCPFKIIYTRSFGSAKEARTHEKYLKSAAYECFPTDKG